MKIYQKLALAGIAGTLGLSTIILYDSYSKTKYDRQPNLCFDMPLIFNLMSVDAAQTLIRDDLGWQYNQNAFPPYSLFGYEIDMHFNPLSRIISQAIAKGYVEGTCQDYALLAYYFVANETTEIIGIMSEEFYNNPNTPLYGAGHFFIITEEAGSWYCFDEEWKISGSTKEEAIANYLAEFNLEWWNPIIFLKFNNQKVTWEKEIINSVFDRLNTPFKGIIKFLFWNLESTTLFSGIGTGISSIYLLKNLIKK